MAANSGRGARSPSMLKTPSVAMRATGRPVAVGAVSGPEPDADLEPASDLDPDSHPDSHPNPDPDPDSDLDSHPNPDEDPEPDSDSEWEQAANWRRKAAMSPWG